MTEPTAPIDNSYIPAKADLGELTKRLGITKHDTFQLEGGAGYLYIRVQKKNHVEQHFRYRTDATGALIALASHRMDTSQRLAIMREMASHGMDYRFISHILDISLSRVSRSLTTK